MPIRIEKHLTRDFIFEEPFIEWPGEYFEDPIGETGIIDAVMILFPRFPNLYHFPSGGVNFRMIGIQQEPVPIGQRYRFWEVVVLRDAGINDQGILFQGWGWLFIDYGHS